MHSFQGIPLRHLTLAFMHYTIILNPAAGNGTAGKRRAAIEAAFQGYDATFTVQETRHRGHGVDLAHQAAQTSEAVVAVGGDGTIQEVARGVLTGQAEAGRTVALGIVPVGTGNDFVKMLDIPKAPAAAVAALMRATPHTVDYGVVEWEGPSEAGEQVFLNAVGIGFDAKAALVADRYKFLPGTLAYLAAVLKTLRGWDAPRVALTYTDAQGKEVPWYTGPLLLTNIGNGRCVAGGFYLSPEASVTDGLFDVCTIENVKTSRFLRILPRALKGKHVTAPEAHVRRASHLTLTADSAVAVHADGEILAVAARRVAVRIVAQGLSVLAGVRTGPGWD